MIRLFANPFRHSLRSSLSPLPLELLFQLMFCQYLDVLVILRVYMLLQHVYLHVFYSLSLYVLVLTAF